MSVDTLWDEALHWANELAETQFAPGEPGSWDARATAGILAVAAYALAQRHQVTEVRELGAERLICPLFAHDRFVSLVQENLAGRLDGADPTDPVVEMWTWLNRQWPVDELRRPVDADVEYPPRHCIGGGSAPKPSIDAYLGWAGLAVDAVLRQERGALKGCRRHPYVRIVGGDFSGQSGRLENPVWRLAPELDRVEPGPPPAYAVTVGPAPGYHPSASELRIEQIPSEHIELSS